MPLHLPARLASATSQLHCSSQRNNRWKSKEVFVTEVLRRQVAGLLPNLNSAFDVYFGTLHLGTIDGDLVIANSDFISETVTAVVIESTFRSEFRTSDANLSASMSPARNAATVLSFIA